MWFSRDSSVVPPGVEEKVETVDPSHFSAVSVPPAFTGARSKVSTCVCTSSGSAHAVSKKLFLTYTWKGPDTALQHPSKNILFPEISS